MGNTIIVTTEFGDVTVHKMPLSDYADLLKALDNVPKSLLGFFNEMDSEKLKSMEAIDYALYLPGLLASSWNDLVAVIAVPTDKDAAFMAKLDLADAVDVVAALLELNDVPRIIAAVKKMLALRAKIAQPTKLKST